MIKIENKYGYCYFSIEKDFCHIHNLFVYPEHRNQKHGTFLLKEAISKIRQSGYLEEIEIVAESTDNTGLTTNQLTQWYQNLGLSVYDYYG